MRRSTLVLLSAASTAVAFTPRATPKALALTLTSVSAVVTYNELATPKQRAVDQARTAISKAMLKIKDSDRRTTWHHWDWWTKVDPNWVCCRGDVFNDAHWRWMIYLFILSFGGAAAFLQAITAASGILFTKPCKDARKKEGDIDPTREHSFMFCQARDFYPKCIEHLAIYRATGIALSYTGAALFLVKLELIQEKVIDGVKLACFDGPRVLATNAIYLAHGGWKRCRCCCEVLHIVAFNFVLGTKELAPRVAKKFIYSSCIWGNDSQNKKPCLQLLLVSYMDITFWDATAMHLWNGKDYLGLFKHFLAIEWRLDIGYPGRGDDSEIKSTTVANRAGAKQQLAARNEAMKIFS